MPTRTKKHLILLTLYAKGKRVAGHWAPGSMQLVLNQFKNYNPDAQERFWIYVMPPELISRTEKLPEGKELTDMLDDMSKAWQGGKTGMDSCKIDWDDVEESETESEVEAPAVAGDEGENEFEEDDSYAEVYEQSVELIMEEAAKVLLETTGSVNNPNERQHLHPSFRLVHEASPEKLWRNINVTIGQWTKPSRRAMADLDGTSEMPTLLEQIAVLGSFLSFLMDFAERSPRVVEPCTRQGRWMHLGVFPISGALGKTDPLRP